jgi:hypothetical protein
LHVPHFAVAVVGPEEQENVAPGFVARDRYGLGDRAVHIGGASVVRAVVAVVVVGAVVAGVRRATVVVRSAAGVE